MMKETDILHALGEVDDAHIAEAAPGRTNRRRLIRFAAAAACLAVIVTGVTLAMRRPAPIDPQMAPITLSARSSGVKVSYPSAGEFPLSMNSYSLVWLELPEIFTPELLVVRGRVSYIQNITLSFNGRKSYRAIAGVAVDEVVQGDIEAGAILPILLPCPIREGYWVKDTDVIARLSPGMEGIFMPKAYDAESTWTENGATLCLADIAPCGLWDGMRWAFLDTGEGVAFDRSVYEEIAGAATLDEVEDYLRRQLG